ncbi:alpha/beta-hydrolase [Thozetella sp. PMI_491]|nr:alpha/beta-hydrolase [Thozetella sp. PMI_491]
MNKREYTYTTPVGSPPVTADVYYPTSVDASSPKPVALLFHPGGFVVSSKDLVSKAVIECLVIELGMVAVVANYRLCPSVSVWEGPVTDAKSCLRWVRDALPGALLSGDERVTIDVERIATIGFSCGGTLALLLAAEEYKPTACLTFYGELYWSDLMWSQPKAALAGLPVVGKDAYNRVYDEGVVVAAPSTRSPTGPDMTKPRNAWLLTSIKEGWWLREIVQDGNYARIDPATLFGPAFPPTAFIHGTADVVCPHSLSEKAHASLREHGVDTALFLVPDKPHDFDAAMTRHDAEFTKVREGLQWLSEKVARK